LLTYLAILKKKSSQKSGMLLHAARAANAAE